MLLTVGGTEPWGAMEADLSGEDPKLLSAPLKQLGNYLVVLK